MRLRPKKLRDYYNMAKEELKEPEERQLREIVVASEGDAKSIRIELLQEEILLPWPQAARLRLPPKGGDLGLIKKGVKSAQFDDVAFFPAWISARPATILRLPRVTLFSGWRPSAEERPKPLLSSGMILKTGLTFLKQQQKIEELHQ